MCDASPKTYLIRSLHDCSFSPDVFPYNNPKVEDHNISQWETDRQTDICISIPVSQPSVTPVLVICQPEVPIQEAEPLPPPANIPEQEEPYFESAFLHDLANNPPKSFTRLGHTSCADESISQAIMLIKEETAHMTNNLNDIISEQLNSPPLNPDIPKTIMEALKHPQMALVAQNEIEMIKKFETWDLVPITDVLTGI